MTNKKDLSPYITIGFLRDSGTDADFKGLEVLATLNNASENMDDEQWRKFVKAQLRAWRKTLDDTYIQAFERQDAPDEVDDDTIDGNDDFGAITL
jgi:hypothetical protein